MLAGMLAGMPSGHDALAAEAPPRVVLIEDPGEATILPRLRAELIGLGLDVRTVAKREPEQLPRDLVELARDLGAVAAFRVSVVADRADVWIADRVTGKVVLRELLPRGAHIDGRVVALRAVELLRASLLELDLGRPTPAEVPRQALAATSGLLPERERFSLTAESALLWSPGGCGPGIGVAAQVAWRPSAVGMRLSGGSVLAPATIQVRDVGQGEVTTRWLALDAVWQPRGTRTRWRPRAGLGLAVLATSLHGVAGPPWAPHRQTVYTPSPIASVGLGWALHPRVHVGAQLAYLRPLRSVDIVVAGASVGSYGRDIVVGSLGVDVVVP